VHGQHLVYDLVSRALQSHFKSSNPSKALVLSFHGWTGSGKNFLSKQIADNIYKKGIQSGHVHLFVGTVHFPRADQIETYKEQLRDWVKTNVTRCQRSMFIFDEVDKLPDGLLDVLVPLLDYHPDINGVDYRKAIFIFVSNAGSKRINKYVMDHWSNGKSREEITLFELEKVFVSDVLNSEGGLFHSEIIKKNLVSVFVPFLPMDRSHVKLCIKDDLRSKNHFVYSDETVDKIANELVFFPEDTKLFSSSGCKRVSDKVDYIMTT